MRSRNWFTTAFRNRTTKFYAVYTSVLDGNKNSEIYFYPPVNRPFHNSCPDNVYILVLFVAQLRVRKMLREFAFWEGVVMSEWCHCNIARIWYSIKQHDAPKINALRIAQFSRKVYRHENKINFASFLCVINKRWNKYQAFEQIAKRNKCVN